MAHMKGRRSLKQFTHGAVEDMRDVTRRLMTVIDAHSKWDRDPPEGTRELVVAALTLQEELFEYYRRL